MVVVDNINMSFYYKIAIIGIIMHITYCKSFRFSFSREKKVQWRSRALFDI